MPHLGRMLRRLCPVLLAALALSTAAPIARSDEPVKMQVAAGFDGRGRSGYWVPVVVDIQNDGPDLAGELQVIDPGAGSGGAVAYRAGYVAEAVLPHGARKRFTLYAPLTGSYALPVRLVVSGRTIAAADASVQPVSQGDLLAGVLSRKAGALGQLGALRLPGGGRQVSLARLRPADLPPNPESLDSFAFLVLADFETADLTPEQAAALEAWVAGGGTLFVAGGPEWRRTFGGLPATLRPVDVQGTVALPALPALADFAGAAPPQGSAVVARGTLRAGRPLVVQDGIPLVVQAGLGAGSIIFLAFDPSLEPVASWAGGLAHWEELLGRALPASLLAPPAQNGPAGTYWRSPRGMANALSNLPALDLPPTELLLGLLGGYILLVGPLNYLVLRRLRRSALAWITVPALALLFGAGTYLVALQGKGGTVLTHTISIIRLEPGTVQQRVRSYIGLFAPAESSYRLTIASNGLVSALGGLAGSSGGPGPAGPLGTRIQREEERSSVDLLGMEMWSMRGIAVEERRSEGEIEADLRVQGAKLLGTVTNRTGRDLKGTIVVAGGFFQYLGDLSPNASASVDLSLGGTAGSAMSRAAAFKVGLPVFYQANALPAPTPSPGGTGTASGGGAPPPPDREQMRRQQILSELFGQGGEGMADEPTLLIGWADSSPVTFLVESQTPRRTQTTVVIAPLRPAFRDDFNLPAGFLRPKILGADQTSLYWTPAGLQFAEGGIVAQFELPAPVQLDELTVEVPVNAAQYGAQLLDARLYNWQTRQWDDLTLAASAAPGPLATVPVPPASGVAPPPIAAPFQSYFAVRQGATANQPYVSPDGLLRVRLVKTARDAIPVGIPALAVKGRPGR